MKLTLATILAARASDPGRRKAFLMYIYLHSEPQLWTVGFYDPTGKFQPESDHDTAELAAVRVAFLNGGSVTPSAYQPAKGATPQPAAPRRLVGPSDLGEGASNPDAIIAPLD